MENRGLHVISEAAAHVLQSSPDKNYTQSHTLQVNLQSFMLSNRLVYLWMWSFHFCSDCTERGEDLTSGRLAARPLWWSTPVVALGNRCQAEGPTGAEPAGNVSFLLSRMEVHQASMCRSLQKDFISTKIQHLLPRQRVLKLVFNVREVRVSIKVFIVQCLKGALSLDTRKSLPFVRTWLSNPNYGNVKPQIWGCWCVGEPEWLQLLSRLKPWK